MADRIKEIGHLTDPDDELLQDGYAPDRRLDGDPTPMPPVSGAREELKLEDWQRPFHLRYRLASIGGVILSVLWLWASYTFIENQMGWENLVQFLPHEILGVAVGILTPLSLLWMVVAFLSTGANWPKETELLRWHMRQLIYPSDRAQTRINEITDNLRRQARDLTNASEDAARRGEAISSQIRRRSLELTQVSEDADLRSHAISDALRRQTEDMQRMTSEAADRAQGVGDVLEQRARELTASADRATARAEEYVQRLGERAEELTQTADYTEKKSVESAESVWILDASSLNP